MTDRRYYGFLDLVVIVAIIRVVINHALNNYFILTTGKALSLHAMPFWGVLTYSLVRFSVPSFVLVAGFKYGLSSQANQNSACFPYINKRLKRLLRPYLIWTLIYYVSIPKLPFVMASNHSAFRNYPFPDMKTIWNILNGSKHPAYQLWFIPMFLLVVTVYPFIKKYIPLIIYRPILWIAYFLIRYAIAFYNLGQPYIYPMYFAFYDLGVLLSEIITRYGNSKLLRHHIPLITILLGSYFTIMEAKATSALQNFSGIVGSELFIPLALFFLCYAIIPDRLSSNLKYLSEYVWPVFIMHEPLVLGSLAWIVYQTFNTSHQVDLILVTISALLFSGAIYALLRKTPLASILF